MSIVIGTLPDLMCRLLSGWEPVALRILQLLYTLLQGKDSAAGVGVFRAILLHARHLSCVRTSDFWQIYAS